MGNGYANVIIMDQTFPIRTDVAVKQNLK